MEPVTLVIVGAGDRGFAFMRLAKKAYPRAEIVAVAEPREQQRRRFAREASLRPEWVFSDWSDVAELERLADGVIVTTPDELHTEPALAFIDKGYHLLLEKPMATSAEACRRIATAAERAGIYFSVGHVLRYTDYTQRMKSLIDSGDVGDVMAIQRLEPIGFDHFAHSYVRGNWRRESESSFSLLTKACHDLDWIRYIVGASCREISSFAELRFFRPERRPRGAAPRCIECGVEEACPYSAKRIYLDRSERGERGWPLSVITDDSTPNNVIEALRNGPYGRCVFDCDNDVADTQLVNMEFENGCLASFMMTAFTPMSLRKTTIFGSQGQLVGDGRYIEHFDFLATSTTTYDTRADEASNLGGHGGGDGRLLNAFLRAISEDDPAHILSGPQETLQSHLMVFDAERARRERSVVRCQS